MEISRNTLERLCRIFGVIDSLCRGGVKYVSSKDLAKAIGATEYTVRKDISLINIEGYTRKGYEIESFKRELGKRLNLTENRKACIVGLGRLGTALLDYEKFVEDGFEIVAGFDNNINKIERIKTQIEVFANIYMEDIIKQKKIELGIITVPIQNAQSVADRLVNCGVKGILNFSPGKVIVPENIKHINMDFTNALRFIAAQI